MSKLEDKVNEILGVESVAPKPQEFQQSEKVYKINAFSKPTNYSKKS